MTVKKPLPFKSAVTAVASPGVDYPSHTPNMGIPNVFVDHSPSSGTSMPILWYDAPLTYNIFTP